MAPEKWLVKDDAQAVADLFGAWAGSGWRSTSDFDRSVGAFRQAMLVPGVAHSALEYYRWAFRAQFRGEGRRFAVALGGRIAAPTLQLHGADDTCILPETAAASVRWAGPHAEPELWPGVGHFPHLEAPDRTSAALVGFLK